VTSNWGVVLIALVVTFDGFPLGYEVFAGNTHDSKTLQTIVATMEARHGMLGRVWITDRGMASNENLAWLRATGRRYIIGAPKSELKKFGAELAAAEGWRTVHDGVEVKLARHGETDETVILVRSADRRSKEKAMHDKFSGRIDAALQRLAARLARARKPIDPARVNRQIGRLLQRNQRAAARFAVALEPDSCAAGFRLMVSYNTSFDDWAALSEGAYLLRSNITDWSDAQLWKAYIQLTQAEAAFRIHKDQLCVRPIWHQREDRVQAHILVCFRWPDGARLGWRVPPRAGRANGSWRAHDVWHRPLCAITHHAEPDGPRSEGRLSHHDGRVRLPYAGQWSPIHENRSH
jgi:transposase